MNSLQASLEFEQGAKAEVLRAKKNLEGEINELEIAVDHANKANKEAQKSIKRYQTKLSEHQCAYEEESKARQEFAGKASLSERHGHALASEVEEVPSLSESAEHGGKMNLSFLKQGMPS